MSLRPIRIAARLFVNDGDAERSRRALTLLMFGLAEVNREYVQAYPETPPLYQSGVLYRAELNSEIWQDIPTLYAARFGDCEDLACARIGELRARGVRAMPYVTWRNVGGRMIYHALVRWPDGRIEDPSRALGMRHPVVRRPVFIGRDPKGLA